MNALLLDEAYERWLDSLDPLSDAERDEVATQYAASECAYALLPQPIKD